MRVFIPVLAVAGLTMLASSSLTKANQVKPPTGHHPSSPVLTLTHTLLPPHPCVWLSLCHVIVLRDWAGLSYLPYLPYLLTYTGAGVGLLSPDRSQPAQPGEVRSVHQCDT